MSFDLNAFVDQAGDRYANFLNILRSQVDVVMRRGPTDESLRQEANSVGSGAARTWAGAEHTELNQAVWDYALDAWKQAHDDMNMTIPESLEDHHNFILEIATWISRLLAAQADRDVVAMADQIRNNGIRVDLNVRSGKTVSQAAAAVLMEAGDNPTFRFMDRTGRNYKSSKGVRDIIRVHLINAYNEIYMAAVFDHGHDVVEVTHPDPNYRWAGKKIAIVSGLGLPTYYEVRDEIFHPSSDARVTLPA